MIYESHPWKQELRHWSKQIEKYNNTSCFDNRFDSTYTIIEKCIMYSAFITRKLVECEKLSNNADLYAFQIKAYKPLKEVDRLHIWLNEDSHNWEHPFQMSVLGKNICNWIIHSYIFYLQFEKSGHVIGFYISSDYDRNKYLYEINLKSWLDYLNYVSADHVVTQTSHYDSNKRDYIISEKEREKL
jgi:hypothetical protein